MKKSLNGQAEASPGENFDEAWLLGVKNKMHENQSYLPCARELHFLQ